MALKVTGARVLVLRDEAPEKIGSILLPEQAKERPRMGIVKAVGPGVRNSQGELIPVSVKEGDRIIYADFAGVEVKDTDGTVYTLINERDILAIVEE